MRRVRKSARAKLKKKLDILWSRLTKEQGPKQCEWCGKKEGLQSDHIRNRGYLNTRWDLRNCILLCVSCHLFRKKRVPDEWMKLVLKVKGEALYEELRVKSLSLDKVDLDAKLAELQNPIKDLVEPL